MRVFGAGASTAFDSDIYAAIEDCIILGVDVANLSLGSSCGLTKVYGEGQEFVTEILTLAERAEFPSLEMIQRGAFEGCKSLRSFTITEKLASFAINDVFKGCDGLEAIHAHENNPYFASEFGVLFDKEKTEIYFYPTYIFSGIIPSRFCEPSMFLDVLCVAEITILPVFCKVYVP